MKNTDQYEKIYLDFFILFYNDVYVIHYDKLD